MGQPTSEVDFEALIAAAREIQKLMQKAEDIQMNVKTSVAGMGAEFTGEVRARFDEAIARWTSLNENQVLVPMRKLKSGVDNAEAVLEEQHRRNLGLANNQ